MPGPDCVSGAPRAASARRASAVLMVVYDTQSAASRRAHTAWDPTAAAELVQYGDLALRNSMRSDTDLAEHGLDQLKSICMALYRILPSGQSADDDGSLRGVTRRSE